MVACPICGAQVKEANINRHIDSLCRTDIDPEQASTTVKNGGVHNFFRSSGTSRRIENEDLSQQTLSEPASSAVVKEKDPEGVGSVHVTLEEAITAKRPREEEVHSTNLQNGGGPPATTTEPASPTSLRFKRHKPSTTTALYEAAPLAERMRPQTLDDIHGQSLVKPGGVLRSLIESHQIPSMILWGGPGTGKTTIARVIANTVGSRFVEINSTSSGVAECKRIFSEARSELLLTGRKTIIFCDEIHRFSKSQQDVFLAPVEAGVVTLIGATTENPSFKVVGPLLSRCRTFTLSQLTESDIVLILQRALASESRTPPQLLDDQLLSYLASFSSGDARVALNLLSLSLSLLTTNPTLTFASLKNSLTQTHLYDRAGSAHYDTISALHKSIRGSDPTRPSTTSRACSPAAKTRSTSPGG